jgi:hypothetical protein
MPRSRIEALLASFPKLADSSTQHTTVEQDNVRFVYQPLDELYMVLITNRQSNILQDIDSLHLFAQVVTSTCKTLDEREILRNAYELLSAFDELVTLGYRENLTISQIKTFLEMESHEERIQEIISRVRWLLHNLPLFGVPGTLLTFCRTRNWRPQKRENEKRSNWKCNARRYPEVGEAMYQEHLYTRHTPRQLAQPSLKPTIRTRQKKTNRPSQRSQHTFLKSY